MTSFCLIIYLRGNIVDRETRTNIAKGLEGFPSIQFATVFGSYAFDRQVKKSDIDVAVAAEKELTFSEIIELKGSLNNALDKEIDLVDLHAVSGLILKESLSSGCICINKQPELYAKLMKKMLYNQADMMPYYWRILKVRREEFMNG